MNLVKKRGWTLTALALSLALGLACARRPAVGAVHFAQSLGRLFFRREHVQDAPAARDDSFLVERVKRLLAIMADVDQAGVAQNRQMMRDGGLRHIELLYDLGHGQRTATAELHDFLPRFVRERFGKFDGK